MSQTFDWIQFSEGRARFAGGYRCWDEEGRDTFALELRGNQYFGEIDNAFLDNHNDYNLVIRAFGYGRGEDVGMPGVGDVDVLGVGVRGIFTPEGEAIARTLVLQLVQAGLEFEDPPIVLDQTDTSHFMGKITFQEGWMLVWSDHIDTSAMADYSTQISARPTTLTIPQSCRGNALSKLENYK